MKTMPLPEIITSLVRINGCNESLASAFLNEFATLIAEGLADSGNVTITGIGTFKLIELADDIAIEFAPDQSLADAVNAPFSIFEPVELDDCVTADMLDETQESPNEDKAPDTTDTTIPTDCLTEPDAICQHGRPIQPETDVPKQSTPPGIPPIPPISHIESKTTPPTERIQPAGDNTACIRSGRDPRTQIRGNQLHTSERLSESKGNTPSDSSDTTATPVTREKIIEKEHLVKVVDKSRHPLNIVIASVISLIAGLVLGYFAYGRINLTGVKSVNISAEDVKVIHQVAGSNVEGVTSEAPSESMTQSASPDSITYTANSIATESEAYDKADMAAEARGAADIKEDATRVVTDTVKSNRYLTTMAMKHYGKKKFWVYIYEENKEKLQDPDMIPANTVVVIPPASKYGIQPGNPASEADAEKRAAEIAKRQH